MEPFAIIHPTAVIDVSAQLAPGVEVGPYALIGPNVQIGPGCRIEGHAVIEANTHLGANNRVCHHAVLGSDSQDIKFQGKTTGLIIGEGNIFREFLTVNRATGENTVTRIGNHNLFLAYTHIAHNCVIGNHAILANATQLGGETVIEDYVVTGGLVGVHQFCRIGKHAFIGACSKVTQDMLPYITADGHPARPHGLNLVGLKRRGFNLDTIARLKSAYHTLFLSNTSLEEALSILEKEANGCPEVLDILNFARTSSRIISRPRDIEDEEEGTEEQEPENNRK